MKQTFFFTLLLSLIVAGCSTEKFRIAQIDHEIDSIKTIYAPDARTAVFKVTAVEGNGGIILRGEVDNPESKETLLSRLQKSGEQNLIDSITILPQTVLEPKIYGIVDVSVASLYAAPKYASELVDQVLLGHTVTVLKEHHGWYYVKSTPEPPLNKGYLGWVDTDNIFRLDSTAFASYVGAQKLIVTSIFATVQSSPIGGTMVSDVVMRDILKPVSTVGSTYKIELPDGRVGYLQRSDAEFYDKYFSTHKPTPDAIESTARRLIGFPYLWGGTSTKGLDCSGFVKTVFGMNGINLPRDASQQSDVGENVDSRNDFANLKKGDLLFFGQKADSGKPERITHVAIYLGDGYFIHSSSLVHISSLVKNDSAFDPYDLSRFVKAKRILGAVTNNQMSMTNER